MALQFSTTYRNAMLNQLPTVLGGSEVIKIWTGSPPASCGTADSGTELVAFSLASSGDWGTASNGQISLANLTLSATAVGTGTAGYFRIYDSSSNCHMQGTCGTSGADLIFNNLSISINQTVQITGFTVIAPGA